MIASVRGIRLRQEARRDRRHRRGARLGDVAAVHQRQQRAGVRIEQQDRRQVRGQVLLVVLAEHRHQLRAEARGDWECRPASVRSTPWSARPSAPIAPAAALRARRTWPAPFPSPRSSRSSAAASGLVARSGGESVGPRPSIKHRSGTNCSANRVGVNGDDRVDVVGIAAAHGNRDRQAARSRTLARQSHRACAGRQSVSFSRPSRSPSNGSAPAR